MDKLKARRDWVPDFSLVHPSARSQEVWQYTRDLWLAAASGEYSVEHVVALDWGSPVPKGGDPSRVVWNYGSHCSVDATNVAAQCAVGKVLVVISDDILPGLINWDRSLKKIPELWEDRETVVRVKTMGIADESGLLTVQILNRKRYESQGYLFHPAYVSMHSDEEFTVKAEMDGVVVDARHITFYHDHPTTPGSNKAPDEVYARQNDRLRYQYGAALLKFRREQGFPREVPDYLMEARLRV
jgi:hypothetical protein